MASRAAVWVALLLVLLPAVPAAAQMAELRKGRLGHLVDLIGGYDYEPVLNDPVVAAALQRALGDLVPVLRRNLDVHASIDLIRGALVLQGNAPHQGYEEEAMVWVYLHDGTVRTALLHNGKFRLHAKREEWGYLPRELRAFFEPRDLGQAPQPPPSLVWVEPKP